MGEMKFTPGPWFADPDERPGMHWNWHIARLDEPHMRVAFMANSEHSDANACLIAAAPELYEALDAAESILRYTPDFTTNVGGTKPNMTTRKALALVRAALAKARGETP